MGRGADGPAGPSGRHHSEQQNHSIFRPETNWPKPGQRPSAAPAYPSIWPIVDINRFISLHHSELALCCITGGGSMFRTGDEELDAIAEGTRVVSSHARRLCCTDALCANPRSRKITPITGTHRPAEAESDAAAGENEQEEAHGASAAC